MSSMHWRLAILASIALATTARAQTGTYTWQASANNGLSWVSVAIALPGTLIKVRLLASWSGITGTSLGYAGGQFDATLVGATALDAVSNIRPFVQSLFPQDLDATLYNGGIKIDTVADTAAPGIGTGWVNPGQTAADFAAPGTYVSDNPAVIFTYDFLWSSADPVTIGMVLNPTSGRAMAIYTSATGSQFRFDAAAVTISTALITIPTPAPLALLAIGALVSLRDQRRHSKTAV